MATNMAPHNLTEVIAAARYLLKHPDASIEQLMKYVPGPDLPTGGHIVGLDGIREAYQTGRGIFRTRATVKIEQLNARKTGIVVTELPYAVGPEKVIARIKDLVQAKKLAGISDLKDLTDRNRGLNLVIEVRAGFNPEAVLAELYRLTPMEETFGINNVALVDGQPRTLGLRELLTIYVDHRLDVTRRRSEFRRRKRQERLHLVDGILVALLNIDEVIQVIRTSDDSAEAKSRLQQVFDLSEIQAQYILDTPLRRLTRYDKLELEREQETLRAEIAELTEILENDETLRALVGGEMADLAKKFGTPRRTVLMEAGAAVTAAVPLEVGDDPCQVVLSATGLLARIPLPSQDQQNPDVERSLVAPQSSASSGPGDIVARRGHHHRPRQHRRGHLGRPDDPGQRHRDPPGPVRRGRLARAAGHPVDEFVPGLDEGETVLALAPLDGGESTGVALGTASGIVKRVLPEYPANRDEFELITLKDGDRVVGAVHLAGDDAELVFIASDAQLLRFPASAVRPQGRQAGGMAASGCPTARPRSGSAPSARRPASAVRRGRGGDGGRPVRRAARHRRRVGQGHPVRRVPAQGPRDRRRPLPALPQGRGRPDPGLDRPAPGPRRDRVRRHGRPVRHAGQARRLRHRPHPPARLPRPRLPAALARPRRRRTPTHLSRLPAIRWIVVYIGCTQRPLSS